MPIKRVHVRQIFDSRGNPTVEVDLYTEHGRFRASVPSGASTGANEAVELRDGDSSNYVGKGVSKAISNVNDVIGPELIKSGLEVQNQKGIDDFLIKLDGTPNKGKLGANAILGVSMAACQAAAGEKNISLYQHIADLAGNKLAFQEFMILPTGAKSFAQARQMATETYHTLKKVITSKYGIDAANVGDEGGFAPNVSSAEEALDLLVDAIEKAGYTGKIHIAVDSASSSFNKEASQDYDMDFKNPHSTSDSHISGEQLAELFRGYMKKYPIIMVEDPFDEEDWDAFKKFTEKVDIQITGDDILCTNPLRIKRAIEEKTCNGLLVKVNQIGTVSETIQATQMAQEAGWGVMVSHRSGETENTFIADLVVGLGVGQIKTGACARSERVAKYNMLLRIEEEIFEATGKMPPFAGTKGFSAGLTPPEILKK